MKHVTCVLLGFIFSILACSQNCSVTLNPVKTFSMEAGPLFDSAYAASRADNSGMTTILFFEKVVVTGKSTGSILSINNAGEVIKITAIDSQAYLTTRQVNNPVVFEELISIAAQTKFYNISTGEAAGGLQSLLIIANNSKNIWLEYGNDSGNLMQCGLGSPESILLYSAIQICKISADEVDF